jgi:hypothetical protein
LVTFVFGQWHVWEKSEKGRGGGGGPLALKAQQDQIKNIGFDIFLSLSLSLCFFKPKTNWKESLILLNVNIFKMLKSSRKP